MTFLRALVKKFLDRISIAHKLFCRGITRIQYESIAYMKMYLFYIQSHIIDQNTLCTTYREPSNRELIYTKVLFVIYRWHIRQDLFSSTMSHFYQIIYYITDI